MHIFYALRKLSSNSKKDDEVHSDTKLNKPIRRIPTDKSKEPKWTIKEERPFTQEEIDAIDKAMEVYNKHVSETVKEETVENKLDNSEKFQNYKDKRDKNRVREDNDFTRK